MTNSDFHRSAGSASELLDLLPRRLDWLFARGRTRPDEPLYGCQIKDGDEIVSQTEHDDPQQCATLAIEGLRVHPCEYCHKKFTGLPGNACENCMNSGLRYPEIEHMGGDTVETDDIKRFFDGMAAANRRSTHMSDAAQPVAKPFSAKENLREVLAEVRADINAAEGAASWPPLKMALWRVLMDEKLNDGHYIKAFDLIEKLYSAAEPHLPCSAGNETELLATLVYEAMRFAIWAAGQGMMPDEGEPALGPEDFLYEYSCALEIDDWEGLAEVARDHIRAVPQSSSMTEAMGEIVNRAGNFMDADAGEWMPSIYKIACEAVGVDPWPMLEANGWERDQLTVSVSRPTLGRDGGVK